MGAAVGIDLGTTNSAVCVKKLSVSSLLNAENDELTPSFVTAVPIESGAGFELVVGKPAQYLMKQYPDQTVFSVKPSGPLVFIPTSKLPDLGTQIFLSNMQYVIKSPHRDQNFRYSGSGFIMDLAINICNLQEEP